MRKFGNWSDIEIKPRQSKTTCPNCSHTRKKPKDPCLYVNQSSGVAKCYNCDILYFRDSVEREVNLNYTLPNQEWKNYTKLSDKLVKWFKEARGIEQYVLTEMGITEEVVYQPAKQMEMNSIVFNYFEGDVLVNKKYRSATKDFTQSKNGKPILYNINSAIGQDEVYICEGEIDVLSLNQIGIKNAVSLPNGANDNDAFWINSEKYLKDVKKFYIAVDCDDKGNEVAEKIAQRLGRYRCERIRFDGKDANEDLASGVLKETINNREPYPVSGTYSVNDLYDKMIELARKGAPDTIKPKGVHFEKLNRVFSTMRGHLITGTGIPSHGKSSFTDWYILNLVQDCKMKVSFFSPEHSPMELYMANLATKAIGESFFTTTNTKRLEFKNWANEKIYLTSADGEQEPNWDWLLETFQSQMFTYGIDIFVIDAFNKVVMNERDEKQGIRKALTRLTSFAQRNNVIIFLIAHPTKMPKENGTYLVPDLYSVSGSADFRNQTHDGFTIYRVFGDPNDEYDNGYTSFINQKVKYSAWQGEMGGEVMFHYNKRNQRYFDPTFGEDNNPIWGEKKVEIKPEFNEFKPLPSIGTNQAFGIRVEDEDDLLPF